MKKFNIVIFLTLCLFLAVLSQSGRRALPEKAVVINNVENMYSRCSAGADIVSQAILGTNVNILQKQRNSQAEDWYQIQTPDSYQGWVIGKSLRFLRPKEKLYASEGKLFVVASLFANIYSQADVTKNKPVTTAPISSVLEVVAVGGERWCEIRLPCGKNAFIQKGDGFIVEAPFFWSRCSPDQMIELARKFLGLPYLWGGTSPFGLDCSGFVQLVYKMCGISILRDADIQFEGSGLEEVSPGQERPGDLVFFGKAKTKISHVGLMITNVEFIHATTHLKPIVQISRLDEAHWQGIYQGARRPKS